MKQLLTLFTVMILVCASAQAVDLDQQDKQYHFTGSYVLGASGAMLLKSQFKLSTWEATLYSALGALAVGFAKEYTVDKRADQRDIQANMLGVGTAAATFVVIEF